MVDLVQIRLWREVDTVVQSLENFTTKYHLTSYHLDQWTWSSVTLLT
jgi:hypothetical protein